MRERTRGEEKRRDFIVLGNHSRNLLQEFLKLVSDSQTLIPKVTLCSFWFGFHLKIDVLEFLGFMSVGLIIVENSRIVIAR